MLGVSFSEDKTAMHFKIHHVDKIRMTYKAEGGGLQTNYIFHKGYTYHIFKCNVPVSKKYLAKRVLPFDDIVMKLFDTEEG